MLTGRGFLVDDDNQFNHSVQVDMMFLTECAVFHVIYLINNFLVASFSKRHTTK